MRLFAVLALPLCATAALLPPTIGRYQRSSPSQPTFADRPVWAEYGLKDSETAVYSEDKLHFTATIWRMQDPTGALSVFDWRRPAGARSSPVAKLAAQTNQDLLFATGNYVILFEGYKPAADEISAVVGGLNNVDNSSLPALPGYLPSQDLNPNSQRYISGPASLALFNPAIPPSVAGFHVGAEAQLGSFRGPKGEAVLTIFNYPTPQIARERVVEFEKLPGMIAKRSGPLVAVVAAAGDPDFAERLAGLVKYQAEITRDEYVPTRRDNIGELLSGVFTLVGVLAVVALVGGLAFGGLRLANRGKKGEEADGVISLNLRAK